MSNSDTNVLATSRMYDLHDNAFFNGKEWKSAGNTLENRPIMYRIISSKQENAKNVLLIGGVHGNETEGVRFMEDFTREFVLNNNGKDLLFNLCVLPVLNPDGFVEFQRGNAAKIDLNRNMPTKDWTPIASEPKYYPGPNPGSEPETVALLKILDMFKPDFIISFHSWKPMININGPAMKFAEKIKEFLDMPIVEDIGYPTPGSLGTYAGWERSIPTITLEFERGIDLNSVYQSAKKGILNSFTLL